MKKENTACAIKVMPIGRITRARAVVCNANEMLYMKLPLVRPNKRSTQLGKTKRDKNNCSAPTAAPQCKKRTVLKDVTNMCSDLSTGHINATKLQDKVLLKLRPCISMPKSCSEHINGKNSDYVSGIYIESELFSENHVDEHLPSDQKWVQDPFNSCITIQNEEHSHRTGCEPDGHARSVKEGHGNLSDMDIVDIDSEHTNPLMCSSYSREINSFQCAAERFSTPDSNFMETVQKDVNQSMRSILIDWLVEVSDEYRLVPDTLYLAVNFIDRYLSENYIERQRLQLLGITCMLIASKYEEICVTPIDEFCSITDNTYTKAEVIKMEIHILRLLRFQLSVPTIKTFLRRFIRVANASYKVPPPALSHLANYLAELTLVEYSFLKFMPSIIGASSVFLAKWTLDRSDHPWNESLVHYTSYTASDLKPTIIALQELQMNTNNCPLNAIREKYKQPKFQSVASMVSPKLLPSLFS